MSHSCQLVQEMLLASADAVVDAAVREHLDGCAACTQFAARHAQLRRAFGELPRRDAPAELAGRVVAACHGGYRQERALDFVARLSRWNVPSELDRKVWEESAEDAPSAPDVLERLVEEDLRDPSKALARRFAGRLTRLSAPDELLGRVEQAMAARAVRPRARVVRYAPALVALGIATIAFVALWSKRDAGVREYSFEVRRATIASLAPEARSILDGLSGGSLSAAIAQERSEEQPR